MLYSLISNFVEVFSVLNVFKYLTVRTGLAMFTSMLIVFLIGNPFINNLAIVPTEVIHLGIEGKISNSTNSYKILSSRRINISDDIKLKIVLKRQLFDTVDYGIFLVSDGREKGLGFSLDWIINN